MLTALLVAAMLGQAKAPPLSSAPGVVALDGKVKIDGIPYATTATTSLYVDPTGNDSNACTASGTSACLTISGVGLRIPTIVKHAVTVNVAAGTYACGWIENHSVDTSQSGAGIWLKGTLVSAALTGSMTGTVASFADFVHSTVTHAKATVTAPGWTAHQLKGALFQITGGTGVGQIVEIEDNTTAVATLAFGSGSLAADFPGAAFPTYVPLDATSTFAIVKPGSVINTDCSPKAGPGGNPMGQAVGNGAGLIVAGIRGGAFGLPQLTGPSPIQSPYTGAANLTVSGFRFSTSTYGVIAQNTDSVMLAWNRFDTLTDDGAYFLGVGRATLLSNWRNGTAASRNALWGTYASGVHQVNAVGNVVTLAMETGYPNISAIANTLAEPDQYFSAYNTVVSGATDHCVYLAGYKWAYFYGDTCDATGCAGSGYQFSGDETGGGGTGGTATVRDCSVSNAAASGLSVWGPQMLVASGVIGTGNSQWGISTIHGGIVVLDDAVQANTITGTAGNVSDDYNTTYTYAQIIAVGSVHDATYGGSIISDNASVFASMDWASALTGNNPELRVRSINTNTGWRVLLHGTGHLIIDSDDTTNLADISEAKILSYGYVQALAGFVSNTQNLDTCGASFQGRIENDVIGGASSIDTRYCLCSYNGTRYAWLNIASGAVGTTTACPANIAPATVTITNGAAVNTCVEGTVAMTGVTTASVCKTSPATAPADADVEWQARPTAGNCIVRVCCNDVAGCATGATVYNVRAEL